MLADLRSDQYSRRLEELSMFRRNNPVVYKLEYKVSVCKKKKLPYEPSWSGKRGFRTFMEYAKSLIEMIRAPEDRALFEDEENRYNFAVAFIVEEKGLVPGNVRLETLNPGRVVHAVPRSRGDVPSSVMTDADREAAAASNASRLSTHDQRLSANFHSLPYSRERMLAPGFRKADGTVNHDYTYREYGEESVRELSLSARGPPGRVMPRHIENAIVTAVTTIYGSDDVDEIVERMGPGWLRKEEDVPEHEYTDREKRLHKIGPYKDCDFSHMADVDPDRNRAVERLAAFYSQDEKVRRRATKGIFPICSVAHCPYLVLEYGHCLKHTASYADGGEVKRRQPSTRPRAHKRVKVGDGVYMENDEDRRVGRGDDDNNNDDDDGDPGGMRIVDNGKAYVEAPDASDDEDDEDWERPEIISVDDNAPKANGHINGLDREKLSRLAPWSK
jgi:hypothetical protein